MSTLTVLQLPLILIHPNQCGSACDLFRHSKITFKMLSFLVVGGKSVDWVSLQEASGKETGASVF